MLLTLCIAALVIVVVLFLVLRRGASGIEASQTQMRMASEVRRSPRVPIAVPVDIHTAGQHYVAAGENISHGGMLIRAEAPLSVAQPIEVGFTLPQDLPISIPAVVSYRKGQNIGLRFDPTHPERHSIQKWVDTSAQEKAANSGASAGRRRS